LPNIDFYFFIQYAQIKMNLNNLKIELSH
jgi:hypothetical protein